jgi:2-polyprenyl-3-methyl-5-hydroxy-6-metoxy-1,4-benzoquinol methylase
LNPSAENSVSFMKKIKDLLYIGKIWLKKLYVYPQERIVPGAQFDYDAYWKVKRQGNMGSLGSWQIKRIDLTCAIAQELGVKSINDIGAGAGEMLKVIKEKLKLERAIAYDSSEYALKYARDFGLEAKLLDINKSENLKFIEPADLTLMFEILEHVAGPEELLQEAYNKSAKGVLFSFPNTGFFIHRFRLFFFGRFPLQWSKHPGEHLRFWTLRDLKWWLKALGYSNYKIYYYMGLPLLKNIWPSMFAAGFFVEITKSSR